jgi:aminomuconate-semialdehyde/2-hydroxymuconate-6-semialdehyde dehydrogenase
MTRIHNYIAGEMVLPVSGRYLDNVDPAIGAVYSQVPDSDAADLDSALEAAKTAFPAWRDLPAADRSAYLHRIADLIDERCEAFARAESIDSGKPITLARTLDIPRSSANLRFFAAAGTQFFSEAHPMADGAINYTLRQPHGVVGCISPWNLPLYLLTWKIAPALAAGNCVIAKPSELTPMTASMLAELCVEVGLPGGVLSVLHGAGPRIGQALVEHPDVPAVSFTGGTVTGRTVAATAAPMFKKYSLELGGKNPNIVFEDCDWDAMMANTVRAAFANQGQICLCGSRVLVQSTIYDRFKNEFVERARGLTIGDPLDGNTQQGAVVSHAHLDKVIGCIDQAVEDGGTVLCGGKRATSSSPRCADGWFVEPTVIEGLGTTCRTNQQEIFGPVATLIPFHDEADAIAKANDTTYGLAASVWSQDVSRCHRVAARLESGVVWVNCWMIRDLRTPIGGFKQSGVGREGGLEAMRFFTEPKNVCIGVARE